MWLWWTLSMIIVVASIAFALYVFISNRKSNESNPSGKKYLKKAFLHSKSATGDSQLEESAPFLRTKLQSLEESLLLYTSRLNRINERLQHVENAEEVNEKHFENIEKADDEEDWKELYYEALNKSEKLENELDAAMQNLAAKESEMNDIKKQVAETSEKRSLAELQLNEMHSLQNKIELLQRELQAAAEREAELEQLLLLEITVREKFEFLQHKYLHLQSETDEMRRRIVEANSKDATLQQKTNKVSELESNLEMTGIEKYDLKKKLEELIAENGKLSATITQLNREFLEVKGVRQQGK